MRHELCFPADFAHTHTFTADFTYIHTYYYIHSYRSPRTLPDVALYFVSFIIVGNVVLLNAFKVGSKVCSKVSILTQTNSTRLQVATNFAGRCVILCVVHYCGKHSAAQRCGGRVARYSVCMYYCVCMCCSA